MTPDPTLAPPDSLLGLLQRGRGLGVQMLHEQQPNAEGRNCVARCLRYDMRWDAQVEARTLYYADAATAAQLPINDIHAILQEVADAPDEDRFYNDDLVATVLGILALRGSDAACDALAYEVRSGAAWLAAAPVLERWFPEERWLPLGEVLFARLTDEEVKDFAEERHWGEPWASWMEVVPRFRDAVEVFEAQLDVVSREELDRGPRVRPDTSMSTARLLEIVEQRTRIKIGNILTHRKRPEDAPLLRQVAADGNEFQRAVALVGLGALDDPGGVEAALVLIGTPEFRPHRSAALRYLACLSPQYTLERARRWLDEPFPLRLAGQRVLERHATIDDLTMLRGTLSEALASDDMYRACFAIDALGCFDAPEAEEELRTFYEETPYAYGRTRAARALARIEGDFAQGTAIECLYDCEPSTRMLGIEHADRTIDGVTARIAQIADDPAERDDVVEMASN